jgi:hypothetical protein
MRQFDLSPQSQIQEKNDEIINKSNNKNSEDWSDGCVTSLGKVPLPVVNKTNLEESANDLFVAFCRL